MTKDSRAVIFNFVVFGENYGKLKNQTLQVKMKLILIFYYRK